MIFSSYNGTVSDSLLVVAYLMQIKESATNIFCNDKVDFFLLYSSPIKAINNNLALIHRNGAIPYRTPLVKVEMEKIIKTKK